LSAGLISVMPLPRGFTPHNKQCINQSEGDYTLLVNPSVKIRMPTLSLGQQREYYAL